jgi:hypothetical protein
MAKPKALATRSPWRVICAGTDVPLQAKPTLQQMRLGSLPLPLSFGCGALSA